MSSSFNGLTNAGFLQLNLERAVSERSQAIERLSSGLRLNNASDDSAGLALSQNFDVTSRLYRRAMLNISDGISITNQASSALDEMKLILTRLQELAVQGSNTSMTSAQRQAFDAEAQALVTEYTRIKESTKFNSTRIFATTPTTTTIQVGPNIADQISFTIGASEQYVGWNADVTVETYTGTFNAAVSYVHGMVSTEAASLATADINGDSYEDAITRLDDYIFIALGNADGTFKATTTKLLSIASQTSVDIQLGDVDGDGKTDIVTSSRQSGSVGMLTVFLGNGDGSFDGAIHNDLSRPVYDLQLGDFTGDGKLDVIYNDELFSNTVRLATGDATGVFVDSGAKYTGSVTGVVAADLDGDSDKDLVLTVSGGPARVLLSNGNGTFLAPVTYTTTFYSDPKLIDVNGDNKLDLILGQTGALGVMLGNGTGSFKALVSFSAYGGLAESIASGDVDVDGKVDLVTKIGGAILTYVGNGDGTFKAPTSRVADSGVGDIAVSDLDNDGAADAFGVATTALSVWLGNSNFSIVTKPFTILTRLEAEAALTLFTKNMAFVETERATVNAAQSRLEVAFSLSESLTLQFEGAAAKIREVDVATEVTNYTVARMKVLAGTAILAQANLQPQTVLSLLEGALG